LQDILDPTVELLEHAFCLRLYRWRERLLSASLGVSRRTNSNKPSKAFPRADQ
jgi:hypothetical protein